MTETICESEVSWAGHSLLVAGFLCFLTVLTPASIPLADRRWAARDLRTFVRFMSSERRT